MRWTSQRILQAVLTLTLTASAHAADEPATPPAATAPDSHGLKTRLVRFGVFTRWPLVELENSTLADELSGVSFQPRIQVYSALGSPLVRARPTLRLTRVIGDDGEDLLARGISPLPRVDPGAPAAEFIVALDGPENPSWMPQTAHSFSIAALPARFRTLEGEVLTAIVTDDVSIERPIRTDDVDEEIMPGVRLRMHFAPRGGDNTAEYLISPPSDPHAQTPILSRLELSTEFSEPFNVKFEHTGQDASGASGKARWENGFQQTPRAFRAHIVLATAPVAVPFRAENLFAASGPDRAPWETKTSAASTTPDPDKPDPNAPSRELRCVAQGYELRLTECGGYGWQTFTNQRNDNVRTLRLSMELRPLDPSVRFGGRRMLAEITAIQDNLGNDVPTPGEGRMHLSREDYGAPLFVPAPDEAAGLDESRAMKMRMTLPSASIPPALRLIRGTLTFLEVRRELVREIDLRDLALDAEIELAPGIVLRHTAQPSNARTLPPPPPSSIYEVVMAGVAHNEESMRGLRVNSAHFSTAGDESSQPRGVFSVRRTPGFTHCVLRESPFDKRPDKLVIHIVVEDTQRVIPFEFRNLPIGAPKGVAP